MYGLMNGVFALRSSPYGLQWLEWMYLLPYGLPHAKLLWDQDAEWAWMMDDPAAAHRATLFVSTSTLQVTPLGWRPGFPIVHGAAHGGWPGTGQTKYDALSEIMDICEAHGDASAECASGVRAWGHSQCEGVVAECTLDFDLRECWDYECLDPVRCATLPAYEGVRPPPLRKG